MKKIMLLDTSIGTSNRGDDIITECVESELGFLLEGSFLYRLPTHLPAFHSYAIWKNSTTVQNFASCDYKFAGGSNLLVKNMLTHYPQWNVNSFNCKPLAGCVLVGVGAGAGEKTNGYTKRLYRKILSDKYCHSVRDERSREYVESLGLRALNTGCVTMWKLTPEFCREIPRGKAPDAVFTLTAQRDADPRDRKLIDVLRKNYERVFFFAQGDRDEEYLRRFSGTEDITLIPPDKAAYGRLLDAERVDYVGTRLHGGIYALRHKRRAIIISIDERARGIGADTGLVTLEKDGMDGLDELINGDFETKLTLPADKIKQWKEQFEVDAPRGND